MWDSVASPTGGDTTTTVGAGEGVCGAGCAVGLVTEVPAIVATVAYATGSHASIGSDALEELTVGALRTVRLVACVAAVVVAVAHIATMDAATRLATPEQIHSTRTVRFVASVSAVVDAITVKPCEHTATVRTEKRLRRAMDAVLFVAAVAAVIAAVATVARSDATAGLRTPEVIGRGTCDAVDFVAEVETVDVSVASFSDVPAYAVGAGKLITGTSVVCLDC